MNDTDAFFDFENNLLTELHAARARSAAGPGPRRTVPGRRGRARRLVPAAVGGAVAAAAVAAVAVANPGGTGAKPAATPESPSSSSSVRNAVLAAFDANAGDMAYAHVVITTRGEPTMVVDLWQSPSTVATGTRVHRRSRITFGDRLQQDVGMIWTEPAGSSAYKKRVTGELIDVEYDSKTWSDQKATSITSAPVYGADQVRKEIAQGYLHVDGPTTVSGKKAIKLSLQGVHGNTSTVWVDASTYLPIKSVSQSSGRTTQTITTDYQMLPSTPSNMASLNVPVPAGFTRTATPPAHPGA
jgi:hypothetical protein